MRLIEIIDAFFMNIGITPQDYLFLIFLGSALLSFVRGTTIGLIGTLLLYVIYLSILSFMGRVTLFSLFIGILIITMMALQILDVQREGGGLI